MRSGRRNVTAFSLPPFLYANLSHTCIDLGALGAPFCIRVPSSRLLCCCNGMPYLAPLTLAILCLIAPPPFRATNRKPAESEKRLNIVNPEHHAAFDEGPCAVSRCLDAPLRSQQRIIVNSAASEGPVWWESGIRAEHQNKQPSYLTRSCGRQDQRGGGARRGVQTVHTILSCGFPFIECCQQSDCDSGLVTGFAVQTARLWLWLR
jgi:hypothetical protein